MEKRYNLQPGDLLLVKDERLPSNLWALGRVTEIHCGQDSLVLVVTLQSQSGVSKQAVA